MKGLATIILLFVYSLPSLAQEFVIRVQDNNTREPVVAANVCLEADGIRNYVTTSAQGLAQNKTGVKSKVTITCVGYKPLVDSIAPGQSKLFLLAPDQLNLEQVVVTGTYTPKTIENTPILTKVVTAAELQESGATTALDALEFAMPGVQFSPDAHGDNLQVQGLDNDYILVLLNGQRLVGEARSNVNFDRLNAANIERIEIVNGASSVLYGSNAIGAVINIITRKAEKPFEASVGSYISRYNETRISASAGTKLKKFDTRMEVFRNSSNGYDLTPESPASYTVNETVDYSAKLEAGYEPGENIRLSVNGTYYDHELANPPKSTASTHDKNKNYTIGGKMNARIWKSHSTEFSAASDRYKSFTVYEKKGDRNELDADYRNTTIKLVDNYTKNKIAFVTGIEVNLQKIYSLELFSAGTEDGGNTKRSDDFNVFAQGDYTFNKQFEVVAGARYTSHSSFGSHFSPKLSCMYSPARFKFRGTLGTGFRTPSLKELYYNFDHHGMFWIYGNPELDPERSFYTSLSAEYTLEKIDFSVTGYRNNIKDKIETVDLINAQSDLLEKHYRNVSRALLRGVESYFSLNALKKLKIKLGYAYSDARDKSTGLQLYGNSKHSGTASFTWKQPVWTFPLSINMTGRASSGRLYQSAETETDAGTGDEITTIYDEKSDPYTIWKITCLQKFRLTGDLYLETRMGINNIFNYRDEEYQSVIDPGRRFFLGIRLLL